MIKEVKFIGDCSQQWSESSRWTEGKTYQVLDEDFSDKTYSLRDDNGEECWEWMKLFTDITSNSISIDIPEGKQAKCVESEGNVVKIEWEDIEKDYDLSTPIEDECWVVNAAGETYRLYLSCESTLQECKEHHNIFPTEELAEKAAKLMKRSNAIISACLFVEPDYAPTWVEDEGVKFYPKHISEVWGEGCTYNLDCAPAYVSSRESLKEVIKLLNKWDIK